MPQISNLVFFWFFWFSFCWIGKAEPVPSKTVLCVSYSCLDRFPLFHTSLAITCLAKFVPPTVGYVFSVQSIRWPQGPFYLSKLFFPFKRAHYVIITSFVFCFMKKSILLLKLWTLKSYKNSNDLPILTHFYISVWSHLEWFHSTWLLRVLLVIPEQASNKVKYIVFSLNNVTLLITILNCCHSKGFGFIRSS